MKFLWALFIAGQIISAGNMNYQQEAGYYEYNGLYGHHPSHAKVYVIKAAEFGVVYGLTSVFPKHKKEILSFANGVCWTFIAYDNMRGIEFGFRW